MALEITPIQSLVFFNHSIFDFDKKTFDASLILKIIKKTDYSTILCRLNKTWYNAYNELILEQLQNLNFLNALQDIFFFKQQMSSSEKVLYIVKKIKKSTHKSVIQLINDYTNFYTKNILRFWERLPGGKKFINSQKIRSLPKKQIIEKFQKWLLTSLDNLEKIFYLDLSNANLDFLPLQINLLKNLNTLDLRNNKIQVIPNLQLQLIKFHTSSNPLKMIFGQQIPA